MAVSARRAATAAGVCTPVTTLLTVAVATALTDAYDWPTDPFSVIGTLDGPAALAFNLGLILAGALALPFAWRLWTASRRALGVLYALLGVSLAVAGLFPMGTPLHAVATGIFLTAWLLPSVAGVVEWRSGRRGAGAAQVSLGTVALLVWLPYDFGVQSLQIGYGAAELVSFVVLALWSGWIAFELRTAGCADATTRSSTTT